AAMTRELDLPALLRFIVREAAVLVEDGAATVLLLDAAGDKLIPSAWHDSERYGRDRPIDGSVMLGEGVTGVVAQTREGQIVNDYRSSPLAIPTVAAATTLAAVMAAPIVFHDRLVGVLALWR